MTETISDSIELVADGLRLRPYRSEDRDALLAAARESVETVGRWLPWCHESYGEADAEAWIAHCADGWASGEHYAFAVYDAVTSKFCGGVGLNQRNRPHNFMNLGYWTRASLERQAIARRGARLVANFGFEQLHLTRIEIVAAPDNPASRKVAEALGAAFEGIGRNRIVAHGKPIDAAIYSLIPPIDSRQAPAQAGQDDAQIRATSS